MTKICLIANNKEEAYRYSRSQNLSPEQWFYVKNINEFLFISNFHVIVVGTNFPSSEFEKMYNLALERGAIGRR
jgi:hypothetical protein